ncbi:zinc finger, PMZ-type containing protein [Tanacetum coccineum]
MLTRHWLVFPSGFQEVEVRRGDEAYEVNLNTKKCVCRMWELSGILCVHAVLAYMHMKMEPELVPGSKLWKPNDFPKPLPPIERKTSRIPRKVRIRHPTENDHEISRRGMVMHYHKCWEVGHNKSTCKNPQSITTRRTETPRPPEPRSNAYKGKGKCPLKHTNVSDVSKTVGKKQGKAGISKWFGSTKTGGAVKKGIGVRIGSPIRMGSTSATKQMDYEALATVEAQQAAEEAKQATIKKIWEENEKFVNDYNHFEEVPLVTPSHPTVEVKTQQSQARTSSKRKQPVRVYVKQRGRIERIEKMQGKNFKFDEHGTGSTPDKAFPVSESNSE